MANNDEIDKRKVICVIAIVGLAILCAFGINAIMKNSVILTVMIIAGIFLFVILVLIAIKCCYRQY